MFLMFCIGFLSFPVVVWLIPRFVLRVIGLIVLYRRIKSSGFGVIVEKKDDNVTMFYPCSQEAKQVLSEVGKQYHYGCTPTIFNGLKVPSCLYHQVYEGVMHHPTNPQVTHTACVLGGRNFTIIDT